MMGRDNGGQWKRPLKSASGVENNQRLPFIVALHQNRVSAIFRPAGNNEEANRLANDAITNRIAG